MEGNTIEQLLELWGVPDTIINTFKENEITADQLPYLDNALLKELIPQMGPRLTVLKAIQELKEKEDPLNHGEASATTITQMSLDNSVTERSLNNSEISSIPGSSHQIENLSDNANIISDSTPIIICNGDDEDILSLLRPRYEDFDLKTLLLTSPLGKSILNYYRTNRKLDNTRRNRLVSIIIKHLYNHIVKK